MLVVWILASQPHQAFLGKAKRFAHRSQMLFDEIPIKAIVTGRDRSMSRENHLPRYARCGGVESDALLLHAHADRFQHRKSAVPFVQVQDARHDAHGFKGAEASDAEHQLLPDSSPRVSAVETRGQLAVVGSIALYIRIEEEKIAASNFHAPDFGMNRTAASFDLHHNRPPVLADGSFQRQLTNVRLKIFFLLPTLAIEALAKISLPVKQADANQRNGKIGCALDMISGQDPESAGIDGKRFVQPEFRGKIGHRTRPQNAGVPCSPGAVRL